MKSRMYWGVVTLIVLLIGVSVFLLTRTTDTETEVVYIDREPIADNAENKPPRPAKEGYKWEWHGDHWHEIQVAQTPPDTPVVPLVQAKKTPVTTYTGPLTFHEELLKTNPVKALRLQAEERGHVNAKWIPPFPPDDTEAQELAKAVYVFIYNNNSDTPKLGIAGNHMLMMMEINKKYPHTSARNLDLSRLTWVNVSFSMGEYDLPSDYFPRKNPYADAFMKYGNSLIKQGHDTEAEQR